MRCGGRWKVVGSLLDVRQGTWYGGGSVSSFATALGYPGLTQVEEWLKQCSNSLAVVGYRGRGAASPGQVVHQAAQCTSPWKSDVKLGKAGLHRGETLLANQQR